MGVGSVMSHATEGEMIWSSSLETKQKEGGLYSPTCPNLTFQPFEFWHAVTGHLFLFLERLPRLSAWLLLVLSDVVVHFPPSPSPASYSYSSTPRGVGHMQYALSKHFVVLARLSFISWENPFIKEYGLWRI
jgi:hypothetical protein